MKETLPNADLHKRCSHATHVVIIPTSTPNKNF